MPSGGCGRVLHDEVQFNGAFPEADQTAQLLLLAKTGHPCDGTKARDFRKPGDSGPALCRAGIILDIVAFGDRWSHGAAFMTSVRSRTWGKESNQRRDRSHDAADISLRPDCILGRATPERTTNSPPSEEQQATFLADIEAYRDELQTLSSYDLNLQVCEELANEKLAQEKRERASFPFWCRLASWSLDDAIALTFAKDPDLVDWSSKYAGEMSALAAPPAGALARLRRQVMVAKDAHQLTDPVAPRAYIAWAKTNGVAILPKLKEWVDFYHGQASDWKGLYEADKPVRGKERNSFNRMILGMAVRGYGCDPRMLRSPKPKEIAEDLADLGISVGDDTVRKRLKEAYDEIGHLLLLPDAK